MDYQWLDINFTYGQLESTHFDSDVLVTAKIKKIINLCLMLFCEWCWNYVDSEFYETMRVWNLFILGKSHFGGHYNSCLWISVSGIVIPNKLFWNDLDSFSYFVNRGKGQVFSIKDMIQDRVSTDFWSRTVQLTDEFDRGGLFKIFHSFNGGNEFINNEIHQINQDLIYWKEIK